MKPMLIAEIGSNHFGNMRKFKQMIRIAKASGATHVKSQAYRFKDITTGSMNKRFYKQCEFSLKQYIDLIYWARDVANIELFYSIFSDDLLEIMLHTNFYKISKAQFKQGLVYKCKLTNNTLISTDYIAINYDFGDAQVLYATEYLDKKPDLSLLKTLKSQFKKHIGYSDHTIGVDNCMIAHLKYNAHIIEKHFTVEKNVVVCGKVFRDTVHGADPKEFEKLATILY